MSIKKLLILSAASVVAVASAAAFAGGPDAMSGPMPAAPAPMMSDWTGWYAGGNLGGAIGNAGTSNVLANGTGDVLNSAEQGAFASANTTPFKVSSGVIGGQLGYNYEYQDFVFGLESNFDYMPQTASATQSADDNTDLVDYVGTSSVSTNWYDTVRGRLGYSFDDDTVLVYSTGGLALTGLTYTNANIDTSYYARSGVYNSSEGQTMIGWNAGGGLEWRFVANWSVNGQYLYNHFGTMTQTQVLTNAGVTVTQNARLTDNIVTAGINYHF